MKSPFFDALRGPVPSPTKFMQLLQEQQLDTVQTSVKAMSCRDPMSLVQLQQSFMQRLVERWAKAAAAETAAAEAAAPEPAAKPAPAKPAAPAKTAAPAPKAPTPPPANEPEADHPVKPNGTAPVAAQDHAPSPRHYDDLTAIKGIGPKFAKTLNEHGITSYKQLAELTKGEVEALEEKLGFSGRFEREGWIEQARELAH